MTNAPALESMLTSFCQEINNDGATCVKKNDVAGQMAFYVVYLQLNAMPIHVVNVV